MAITDKIECPRLAKVGIGSVKLVTRDAGFEHERNDCFVKALQAATGVPYRDAHKFCETFLQRRPKHGTPVAYMALVASHAKTIFRYRVFAHKVGDGNPYAPGNYETLAQFVASHRQGRYVIWSNRHALAVIDGVVHDNGAAGPRIRISGVYEFKPSSQV